MGRKDTARSGSREWGEAGPGFGSGSRPAARVREARDSPPAPSQGLAFGNGADTHMAELDCKDLALSVLSALPGLLAPQLLLSPQPAPAPPSVPPPRPAGPHLLRSPAPHRRRSHP